jgi:hypothetical protein
MNTIAKRQNGYTVFSSGCLCGDSGRFCVRCSTALYTAGIKVKKSGLAERCEICHQSDMFNPENNTCKRCDSALMATQISEADYSVVIIPKQQKKIEFDVLILILLITLSTFIAMKVYQQLPIHLWIGFVFLLTLISYKISDRIACWLYRPKD